MTLLKQGVSINGVKPEIVFAIDVVSGIYESFAAELVITSINDSKHGYGSLHYIGYAFDCRIRNVEEGQIQHLVPEIKQKLGNDFDVLLEKDHIHIEFQPKKGINL